MTRITTKDIAEMINNDCEVFRYFWAYGLLKETHSLFVGENASLLCDTAKIMLSQIQEVQS